MVKEPALNLGRSRSCRAHKLRSGALRNLRHSADGEVLQRLRRTGRPAIGKPSLRGVGQRFARISKQTRPQRHRLRRALLSAPSRRYDHPPDGRSGVPIALGIPDGHGRVQLTLSYVLLPRLFSTLFNVPSTANSSAVITNEIVQYVGMAILTPIQYYACRALGSLRRTPMAYVKLCVLSVSFGALLSSVIALLFFSTAVHGAEDQHTSQLDGYLAGLDRRRARRHHRLRRGKSSEVLGNVLDDGHRRNGRYRCAVVAGGLSGPGVACRQADVSGTLGNLFG